MKETVIINYDIGSFLTINLGPFFDNSTLADVKKLNKTINMDYQNRIEIYADIIVYITAHINTLDLWIKSYNRSMHINQRKKYLKLLELYKFEIEKWR